MTESLVQLGRRLRADTRGLTTVEYTIVLCLIAALCVGVWKQFGDNVQSYITKSKDKIAAEVEPGL